jgi:TRAP-type C4-dicarboxylate transport system substrate-binding protein
LEITRIKKIQHNELMIFVENSFYRRIWLNDYTPDQQQIIIDTIKAYGERFSLRWVEEQKEAAVA